MDVDEGMPCLMVHGGLGGDHSALHPWLDPLGNVTHPVYYDHRGNGRSARPPSETTTFEQLCADVDALREHLGFEMVAVLGHSFTGFIALEYALRYPERLSHLILLDPAPTLILVGRGDFICPPSQARILHEGIPNSELVVFENSGHFAHVEESEAFFDAGRGWLKRTL